MRDSRVTVLPDGRDLGWLELGDPEGVPVFAFHGTPGSRLQFEIEDSPIRAAGLRLICPDRPGYGLSTFQLGRRLVDWPADVAYLADHLGIDRSPGMKGTKMSPAVRTIISPHTNASALSLVLNGDTWYQKV